jgi:hypothetical protein
MNFLSEIACFRENYICETERGAKPSAASRILPKKKRFEK